MTPEEEAIPRPVPLTVALLLTCAPHYLAESLTEIAPLAPQLVLIPLDHRLDMEPIQRQAEAALGDHRVSLRAGLLQYAEAVRAAHACAGTGWLLLLEADECVDGAALGRALAGLPPDPNTRYRLRTLFFWHDGRHVIEGPQWDRAAEKVRLIWVGAQRPSRLDAATLLEDCCVYNYAHAVPEAVMRQRVPMQDGATGTTKPDDWFSPWWRLGVNRAPQQVKRFVASPPPAMQATTVHRVIHDEPSPVPDTVPRPLVWEGWIGQEISYGVITDYTVRYLEAQGWEPHVYPTGLLGPENGVPAPTRHAIQREQQRRESLERHKQVITVKNSHTTDWMQLRYSRAAIKIGYSPHERVALEPQDVLRANRMDVVMVTSSYVQRVYEASGVRRPFYIYHHGYDPQWLRPLIRSERPTFTFLAVTVLNLRKGPDILLETFAREFHNDPDVRLVVKTSPHVWHEELHAQLLARYGNHPQITFLQEHHTEAQLAQLYYSADCFVLPTRGEGFGMPILEAMATGLPVIVTDWSGHLDFCTPENSYLVNAKNRDQLEFVMGVEPWWAAPDEEHLAAQMRHVVEHRKEARQRGQRAAADVAHWTWENQVGKLHQFLNGL